MSGSSSSESEDVGSDVHYSDEEFPVSGDESLPDDDTYLEDGDQKESNWANALKKALKSSKDGQSKVLSKAKKMTEIERIKIERKGYGFEIDGEVKPDTSSKTDENTKNTKEVVRKMMQRREIRENLLSLRVKPTINDREREKSLQKIGTKGIVQLFNAVRAQQKDLDIKLLEAGKPEYKREKVLKNVKKKTFLDALMNGPRAKSELVDNPIKSEMPRKKFKKEEADSDDSDTHKSIWSALKDDFMTNNKNWDKSDEEAVSD